MHSEAFNLVQLLFILTHKLNTSFFLLSWFFCYSVFFECFHNKTNVKEKSELPHVLEIMKTHFLVSAPDLGRGFPLLLCLAAPARAATINPLASLLSTQLIIKTQPVTLNMSQKHWVSFEDKEVTPGLPQPLTSASKQPQLNSSSVMPSNPFHDMMSQRMTQTQESSSSRYSAFDKIRQEELRGGDLGWSEEITGSVTNEKAALWTNSQSEVRTSGFRGSGA